MKHMIIYQVLLLLLSSFSRVWLCATPQMAAHQAPPSLGFSRQGPLKEWCLRVTWRVRKRVTQMLGEKVWGREGSVCKGHGRTLVCLRNFWAISGAGAQWGGGAGLAGRPGESCGPAALGGDEGRRRMGRSRPREDWDSYSEWSGQQTRVLSRELIWF